MKNIKKVLVGLDLSPMDKILIRKTKELVEMMEIEMVYFVHVAENLALPEEVTKAYPDLMAPLDEAIEKEIADVILHAGYPEGFKFEVEAKEGHPMETVLRWSKVKDVDCIFMGRKNELEGSGSLAKGIAQKSPCSVLLLTESKEHDIINKIAVPIDFSPYSLLSLEFAQQMANDPSEIECFHLYDVPIGYSKTGKSHEEFAEIMLKNARKDFQDFIRKNHLPLFNCKFILNENGKAKTLLKAAKDEAADFIIIGSRGRTDSAALLLGSIAERLININNEIPMLVLKKKGENMHFLEALFRV